MTGRGSIDPDACTDNRQGTKLCCSTSFSGVAISPFSFAQSGTVDFSFAGTTCQKPTVITLKGAINITSGSGVFTGITGSGKLKGKLDPSSWDGSVSAHGNYALPP